MRGRTTSKESPHSTKQSLYYRKTIESLKEETKKLKDEISQEKFQSSTLGSESYIARLQDQGDYYSRKIKQEKQRIDDLDSQIAEVQGLIEEKRKAMNESKEKKESNQATITKIKKIEHKLDKTLQKYNEAIAENKHLREEIDALRREKKVFQNIYASLEDEYKSKEEERKLLKEEKEKAKKKRDEASKKLNELKENKKKAEKELESFGRDWQELERIIEKESNINDILESNEVKPLSAEEEKDDLSKAPLPVIKDKALIKQSVKMVEQYEEAFRKIEEATGITDIESLVNTFIEAEKHNYSLFNYVNELANEIEKLEKQISQIKQDIEEYKGQGVRTENQRKKIMSDLEVRLSNTEARAEAYERKYEKTMVTINALKLGVEQILEKVGCNNPAAEEMIQSQGVNEANLMQCLSIIELRTNEILQMYEWCTSAAIESSPHLQPANARQKMTIKYDTDNLPIIGDASIDDEEGNEPFSKKKLLDLVIKKEGENSRRK
jgi:coiled-coil domain-containing protein 63/114